MLDTDENRVAHLNLIEGVINRLSNNSFLLKGWSVTIVSALFALASIDVRHEVALIAIAPAFVFWGLDAYTLRNECRFRELYSAVHSAPPGTLGDRIFSMDTQPYLGNAPTLTDALCRPIVFWFHGAIVLALLVGVAILLLAGGDTRNAVP